MNVSDIAIAIEKRINALEEGRKMLNELSSCRAVAIADYDKAMALTIMKLRNGIEFNLDGVTIKDPPVTILEKIAKGLCWESRLRLEESEAQYKSAITKLEILQAQLMGYQSIYRHQSEV